MRSFFTLASAELLLAGSALGLRSPASRFGGTPPVPLENLPAVLAQNGGVTNGTFQQLIDHDRPELGTFTQHFFFNGDYYAGPGSPMVLTTPGEGPLEGFEGYATNRTITGLLAQQAGAGVIVLEHRYWGLSSPFQELTTANMRHLTLDNSMRDLTYFARNVELPFDQGRSSTPDKAPWVLQGCSYSGALTAWTHDLEPGTFWAYHASSAVVEAIDELWQYAETVGQAMPRNCSADVERVIDAVDRVLLGRNETAKHELKEQFGAAALEHDDDFAGVLIGPLGLWQSTSFADGYGNFSQWCDYVENQWPGSSEPMPGPEGVGVDKALAGYAKFVREVYLTDACDAYGYWKGPGSVECFNTYNRTSPLYTDLTPANTANRQWWWFLCNEPFEWWQDRGKGRLVSRLLTQEYFERQCGLTFAPDPDGFTFSIAYGADAGRVNRRTGGWRNVDTTRLVWTVGELDPWRPATVSSAWRPGGPLESTPEHPVFVIPGAAHCGDQAMRNAAANEGVEKVVDAELTILNQWISEFYSSRGISHPGHY